MSTAYRCRPRWPRVCLVWVAQFCAQTMTVSGISAQSNGEIYRNTYSPELTLNCNGASTSEYACGWSNWSKQFVYNSDDIYVHSSMGAWGAALMYGPGMAKLWRDTAGAVDAAVYATGAVVGQTPARDSSPRLACLPRI